MPTIDKAIKTNEDIKRRHYTRMVDKERDAISLGIEALKGIKKVRKTFRPFFEALLPGETEE